MSVCTVADSDLVSTTSTQGVVVVVVGFESEVKVQMEMEGLRGLAT